MPVFIELGMFSCSVLIPERWILFGVGIQINSEFITFLNHQNHVDKMPLLFRSLYPTILRKFAEPLVSR